MWCITKACAFRFSEVTLNNIFFSIHANVYSLVPMLRLISQIWFLCVPMLFVFWLRVCFEEDDDDEKQWVIIKISAGHTLFVRAHGERNKIATNKTFLMTIYGQRTKHNAISNNNNNNNGWHMLIYVDSWRSQRDLLLHFDNEPFKATNKYVFGAKKHSRHLAMGYIFRNVWMNSVEKYLTSNVSKS